MKKNNIKIPLVEKIKSGKVHIVKSNEKMKGLPGHRDGMFLIEIIDRIPKTKKGGKNG